MSGNRLFVIAGEASGDLHASGLIRQLRLARPGLEISCVGGEKMASAGASVVVPSRELSVVGLLEVASHIRPIISAYRRVKGWLRTQRPDLLILVDFPEFNLLMARHAKALGIPVFYYISPQIWAWRQGRVEKIKRVVDKMAVILPFEEEFYERYGVDVSFVGHPLLDVIEPDRIDGHVVRDRLALGPDHSLVCLLPGSRKAEIERHLPVMLEAASIMSERHGSVRFCVAVGSETHALAARIADRSKAKEEGRVEVLQGCTYEAIRAADLCIAASGTVTLETAIIGTPSVVMYRVSRLSYLAGRRLIKVPWISLVNLIAQEQVVPELIQDRATAENIASHASTLLTDEDAANAMRLGFERVRRRLGSPGAARRAAEAALELLDGSRSRGRL